MTPESAGFNLPSLPPLITAAGSLVILIFGLVGAYLAMRRKGGAPVSGQDVPQWFYVRDLVHEIRNQRQAIEGLVRAVQPIHDGIIKLLDRSERP